MKKCNSDFVCEEDLITMDPIADDEPCVAVEDNMCATCETINTSKNSNPILFNENPLKAIFNKNATLEENERFWGELRDNCAIERPETSAQAAPAFYVAEPDYEELDRFQDIIQRRIQQYLGEGKITNNNASRFINTMYKVARAPVGENFTTKADPSEFLRIKIKNILEDDACSSQITHKTLELPLTIYTYFSDLSNAEESKFIGVVKFLDQASQLCIDGTFERFDKILSGGKNKRTKGRKTRGRKTKGRKTRGRKTKGRKTKGRKTKGKKTKGRK